jgi:hypothetical protein
MAAAINAARRGCALCGGKVRLPPAGPPFPQGPYVGRYWCSECWILYWDEHPEELSDEESRNHVALQARKIRIRRAHEERVRRMQGVDLGGAEILFEEGEHRAFLTSRGTVVFSLGYPPGATLAPDEYDRERLALLGRALRAVEARLAVGTTEVAK